MDIPTENKRNLDESAAFRKIERLLNVRDRSIYEIKDRLSKDGFEDEAIATAIERAMRCGYLDDRRFADMFIRSRLRAGKGMVGIVRDLKRHHIDPETLLDDFPNSYEQEFPDQLESALHLLRRKPPHAKNLLNAAYSKLIRSGYSSSIASQAARQWLESCR